MFMDSPGGPHNMVRGACAWLLGRVIGGQCSAIFRARSQLSRAALMSRLVTQVAAVYAS